MKKKALAGLLALWMILLSGCGAPDEASSTPSPSPLPTQTPLPAVQGPLADAVRALLNRYAGEIDSVAAQSPANRTYAIPGDLLTQMARNAQAMGVAAENGRYRFSYRQSGQHTYLTSALEIQEEMEAENPSTPSPLEDAPMDSQQMGDFVASGGGMFERRYDYDAAEDVSSGTAEITDTLNGETTGHEWFSFCVRGNDLYFVDAALDLSAGVDGLEGMNGYLVAAGVIRGDGLEIIEYHVAEAHQLPDPAHMDLTQLISSVTPLSHIRARGRQVEILR